MPKTKNVPSSAPSLPREIPAPDYIEVVWEHLTDAVCNEVFAATRDRERQRKWTLFSLLRMWMGLLQSGLASQTEAVGECDGNHPLFPQVEASPESFFQRVQSLRPAFFRNIFLHFTQAVEPEFGSEFQKELGISEKEFPHIYAIDGSRLAQVGRLLKVARTTTKVILPGSLEAVYDLRGGFLKELWFDPDGAKAEILMFEKVLKALPAGSLTVNDRYYPKPVIWEMLQAAGVWMVSRYNKTVKKRKKKVLKKIRHAKIAVDDWIVEMGGSAYGSSPVTLRWVHVWNSEFDIILITNVLEPERLSVDQLLGLYRQRWMIERMYLHLKDVLALNRLFNASPSAVGQQVYATAILYNALRLSQVQVARRLKVPPERLSPDKLFPQLIERFLRITWMMAGLDWRYPNASEVQWRERQRELMKHPGMRLSVKGLLVQKRLGKRKQRRFCQGRKSWTTYRKIPGGQKYLQN